MSDHIHKSHNVNLLLYHLVCPAKYRREVFSENVEAVLKIVCSEISKRYEINYVEIGSDQDHVHFLIQSVPLLPPTRIVPITKSITAREIFKHCAEVKKFLWGGEFWTKGYYINTVGRYANEKVISDYVKNQGKTYTQIHRGQLGLFEGCT
ncbi:MAG TPA: IS200/IS605 family transposase [Candidatus Paceibacterota bacterium]|nr:IS200/IS605 family transposase [Candidatus Paceibacterota bacterium]